MRITAFFPLLCTGIALILSFLCVFAGTNHDMLEGYDILVLNTSRIGVSYFNSTSTSTSSAPTSTSTGFFTSLIHNATSEIHNLTNKVETDIETDINDSLRSLARDIGIHDFYSVHILNYCEGFFRPNGTAHRNVTHCSNRTGMFTFNPAAILQKELNSSASRHPKLNITLGELHWPDAVTEGVHDVALAFHVTFVLYCIGLFFTSMLFLFTLLGVFIGQRGALMPLANILTALLAFGGLLIASSVVTYAGKKVVDVVNKYGKEVDINASRGMAFISMTWAGTALVGVAGLAWCVELAVVKYKARKMPKQV